MDKSKTPISSPDVSLFSKTKIIILAIQHLSLAKSHEEIRDIVKHAARELVGSDGATFILRDIDQCYYIDEDAIAPLWKGRRFPMNACISGWVMLNKKSAIIPDIYVDPRIPVEAYRPTFVKSLIMVPIRKIDPIGAIGNYWGKKHQPMPEEILLLEALADSTAIAMENVNVYLELEKRVQQRTLELELVNQELEAFSYSISHDLRTPLRAIDGFVKIFIDKHKSDLNDSMQEILDKVILNSSKMTELIDALLILSRITKTDIEQVNVDLTSICKDMLKEYVKMHPDRNIHWHVDDGLKVKGDRKLLQILCENILNNACKFTSKIHQPDIRVERQLNDQKIVIKIIDNGIGFEMDQAQYIFEPFKRLHHEREFAGTGIGLAIVKRIVKRHNGSIWVKSKPNKGTTFYIELTIPVLGDSSE